VKAAPDSPGIRFHLAQALAKAGDKAKALSEIETLLATDSKFPQRAAALKMQQQLSK
jgi:thioredoxin-like negative regulator of GroEL